MNRDVARVRTLLKDADPAAVSAPASGAQKIRLLRETLDTIVTRRPSSRTVEGRNRMPVALAGAVGAIAALVMLCFVGLPGDGDRGESAYAATLPVLGPESLVAEGSASAVLDSLAQTARATPTPGEGSYEYVRTRNWFLDITVPADSASATSALRPDITEEWMTPDGSLLIHTHKGEAIPSPGQGDSPPLPSAGLEVQRFPPTGAPGYESIAALPRDPARLASTLLATVVDRFNGTAIDANLLMRVGDLMQRPLPADLQASLLEVLADRADLRDYGAGHDLLGRPGRVIGIESGYSGWPTSYQLVLSADTGRLLALTRTLTQDVHPGLRLKAPAILGYEVVEDSRWADEPKHSG